MFDCFVIYLQIATQFRRGMLKKILECEGMYSNEYL